MNDIVEKRYSELLNKPKKISFMSNGVLDPNGEKILLKNLDIKYCYLIFWSFCLYALLACIITYPIVFYIFSIFTPPYGSNSSLVYFFILNVIITLPVTFLFLLKKNNLIEKVINKMIRESPEEIKKQIRKNIQL